MLTILNGDALEMLRTLPDESVQCCVTSAPYWGLRDYGTARWEGGDAACPHQRQNTRPENPAITASNYKKAFPYRQHCRLCGARRIDKQIGLERTPRAYLRNIVAVFEEVRRVLKADGTLWLNMGDAYAGSWGGASRNGYERSPKQQSNRGSQTLADAPPCARLKGQLKPKDLIGMPWRVAFALQAAGWYLRSDIIWHKPNPMPESVTDRPTKSHEYLFLFAKSERYYYDAEAIKEPASGTAHARGNGVNPKARLATGFGWGYADEEPKPPTKLPNGWAAEGDGPHHTGAEGFQGRRAKTPGVNSRIHQDRDPQHSTARKSRQNESFSAAVCGLVEKRNARSVWTVSTAPYREAHFATFPPALIKPCILAGSRPGDLILDPFGGSGTTGMVALELARQAVLIELNPAYCDLIRQRCAVTPGLPLQ